MRRWVGSGVVALAIIIAPAPALADDPRAELARKHHRDLEFEKCLDVLRRPAPPLATEAETAEAEVLSGVCNFELGREAIAGEHFRRAVRADDRATLPPYSSPKMRDAFAVAREEVSAALAKQRIAPTTPAPASSAPAAPAPHTRTKPFPVLGVVLGGAALGFGSFGTFSYVRARDLETDANRARYESDAYSIGDRARTTMAVANVCIVSAVVLAGAAVFAVIRE